MTDLTPMQEKFATGLAKGLSQAEAYRKAYPASKKWKDESVWTMASKLAADTKVCSRVAELTDRAAKANQVSVDRVLKEYARLAFMDPRKLFDDDGRPLAITGLDDDTAAAIIGIDVCTTGNDMMGVGEVLKLKIADKKGALDSLARHLGMFNDKLDITVKDELAERLARARKRKSGE